jgi:hypothetical protein
MTTVGTQEALLRPVTPVAENATRVEVSRTASAGPRWPGTSRAVPLLAVAGPDQ